MQCIQLSSIPSYYRVCSVMFNALKIRDLTDTQAIDVVTFDFKGTRVRCFVSGFTDH